MAGADLAFDIFARDRGASSTFRKVGRAADSTAFNIDHLSKVSKTLGGAFEKIGAAGKFAAIAGAAAAAVPHVVALAAALASTAPAAAVLAPAALAAGAAFGVLKLATHGLDKAFTALSKGDTDKFKEALKGLAPEARKFAIAVRDLKPALDRLQTQVQNQVFQGWSKQLKPIITNLLPSLRRGLLNLAFTANDAGLRVAAFLKSGVAKSNLQTVLAGINRVFAGMGDKPALLMRALLNIAVAAMPAFERLASIMGRALESFAAGVSKATANGGLKDLVNGAVATLEQLGRIAGNVGRIIGSLFKASGDSGAGLLNSIERITTAMANFANSAKGQEALSRVLALLAKFGPMVAVGGALASVLGTVASAVASLATPAGLVAIAIAAVAAGFIVLWNRSREFREMAGQVAAKARELWDLFLTKGMPVLRQFASQVIPAVSAALRNIQAAIADNKPQLMQLWNAFKSFTEYMMTRVWPVFGVMIIFAIRKFGQAISGAITVVGAMVRAMNFVNNAGTAAFRAVSNAASSFKSAISSAIGTAITFISSIPGRARAAVGNLGSILAGAGRALIDGLIRGIRSALGSLRSTLGNVTSMIPSWKGPMDRDRKLLTPTGQAIMGGLMRGIASQVPALARQLQGVTAGISSPSLAAAGMGGGMSPAGRSAAGGFGGGVNVNVTFTGPVGSQRELQDWLVRALDSLKRGARG